MLGNSSDLLIFHDGTDSHVDNNTGDLYLTTTGSGDDIHIRAVDDVQIKVQGTENAVICTGNGSVDLYYDGIKTLETISGGAKLQGGEGIAAHLYMFADEGDDNADKWVFRADASSSQLKLRNYASGSWEESIIANGNGSVELYYDNSKKFETTSDGASVTGHLKSYHLKPMANNTYDVGTTSLKWRDVYATNFHGDGSNLTGISAGATGGGSDEIFYENGQNVTTDYTITNGKNAMSAGPITIDSGVTVTVGSGETLTIV